MTSILILLGGFLMAITGSELALKGTKLQTGLLKVLLIHIFCLSAVILFLSGVREFSLIAILIFWIGAFLSWFGVRSHLESSILLRMLFLLRTHPMSESELLGEYESHYSEAKRFDELLRATLLERGPDGIRLTPKGKWIASVAAHLSKEGR